MFRFACLLSVSGGIGKPCSWLTGSRYPRVCVTRQRRGLKIYIGPSLTLADQTTRRCPSDCRVYFILSSTQRAVVSCKRGCRALRSERTLRRGIDRSKLFCDMPNGWQFAIFEDAGHLPRRRPAEARNNRSCKSVHL
ncbi:hypothetical protein B0T20DRAFT_10758 [Sordaria brevicollis]|uniref:Uncharacterized protein n=1 Tax=Sordaria brevicollis TaxID=83679 RepID=A0AAE0PNA5_SORBR|nr:hypothetical protein B0T20DRAFT_10758 [Sordaria brevicollis]